MSIQVVITQMSVMFVFIVIGYFMAKRGDLLPETCKQISGLIVNVCSPAMVVTSVLTSDTVADYQMLLKVLIVILIIYVVLIVMGVFMGRIMRAPKEQWDHYNMMTVFRNIGFIGFPVVYAVLGPDCMIYAAMYNLVFNILVYTYGIVLITRKEEGVQRKFEWKKLINTGNLAAIVAIVVYIGQFKIPGVAETALTYMANVVTFLSVLVIGASVARHNLKVMFLDTRMYVFIVLRMIIIPVTSVFILKCIFDDPMIVGVLALLIAMPVANMTLMMAEMYDQDTTLLSRGIVLSTLCSVVTITITALFV